MSLAGILKQTEIVMQEYIGTNENSKTQNHVLLLALTMTQYVGDTQKRKQNANEKKISFLASVFVVFCKNAFKLLFFLLCLLLCDHSFLGCDRIQ